MQSWKDSLALLRRENLKPFLLVTAKTVLDIYKAINKPLTSRGNWILFAMVGVLVLLTNALKLLHLYELQAYLFDVIRYSLVFIFVLALRPSVDLKSWEYYSSNIQKFWYLMIGLIVLGTSWLFAVPFVYMFTIFFVLAALDTHGALSELLIAARTSIRMLIYNFPICACAYAVLAAVNIFFFYLLKFVLGYFGGLTLAVFLCIVFVPIEVALLANLYIKFLHAQPSLYFKQPE
jgi:hypothetical protein